MNCVYRWARIHYVITTISQMESLPNFLTHGTLLRACESSTIIKMVWKRPSDPDAKYQPAKLGHAQKAKLNFEIVLGLQATQQS